MHEARPGHDGQASQAQKLLPVNRMIQAHAVTQRIGKGAGSAVLILELISHGGLRPAPFRVVALVVEAGAVDVSDGVEGSIDLIAEGVHAAGLVDRLDIGAVQRVLEAGEAMLPARRPCDRQFRAGQQVVLPRALVEVRRQDGIAVEIPVALHAGSAIGVAGTKAQSRPVVQLHADVPALQ